MFLFENRKKEEKGKLPGTEDGWCITCSGCNGCTGCIGCSGAATGD